MTHQDQDYEDQGYEDQDYEDDPLHEEDYHWGPWGGYEGDDELPEDCEPPEPAEGLVFIHRLDDCPFDQTKGG